MNKLWTWTIKDSNKYYDLRIFSVVFVINREGNLFDVLRVSMEFAELGI